jgi:hypothetical protein
MCLTITQIRDMTQGIRIMNSQIPDPLSPQLRSVEREIDNYYKQNPLIKCPFAVGAWHFMAFCEDMIVMVR